MAVKGDLKDLNLPTLVQMICMDKRDAALVLRRQRIEEGLIVFSGGEIVHARAGSLVGDQAVYSLLSWTDGAFQMRDNARVPRRTVTSSWRYLLMEGMRKIDEANARAAQPDEDGQRLSAAQIKQDHNLENGLISLLSTLEHTQSQLAHKRSWKRPSLALKTLSGMVNDVVAFSETRLGREADSLTKALAVTSDRYAAARLLQVRDNRLQVQAVVNLYRHWDTDAASRRQMFVEVAKSLLDVLEIYFLLCAAGFNALPAADQWREMSRVFLDELTQVVEKIKF